MKLIRIKLQNVPTNRKSRPKTTRYSSQKKKQTATNKRKDVQSN